MSEMSCGDKRGSEGKLAKRKARLTDIQGLIEEHATQAVIEVVRIDTLRS